MRHKNRLKPLNDENGSMLIVVVIIIMVLTSLGLYGLMATDVEIAASASEKRSQSNFNDAESGMKFAIANFELIYRNSNNAGGILYSGPQLDISNNRMTFSMGDGGVINSTDVPSSATTALKEMINMTLPATRYLSTGSVDFNFAVNGTPIARVEIKAITRVPYIIPTLSPRANDVPNLRHLSPPPAGSDSDHKSRNYCITSTALDTRGNPTNSIIQCGVLITEEAAKIDFLETE